MSVTELPVIDGKGRLPAFDLRALHDALTRAISTHDVRYDRLSRALYATDASVYQIVPLMVAFPATADDVAAAVRVCAGSAYRSPPGRRHLSGRPVDRSRRDSRLFQALRPRARNQSRRALGSRRAGMRARRSEPRPQATPPAVRPGHLDIEPGDDRRHDRQ